MTANLFAKVRKARFGLMLLAAFCITVLTASPAKATIKTTLTGACPIVVSLPGDYFLSENLTCPPNVDGIDIETSNVKLHLAGHTIAGACGNGFGIHVLGTSGAPLTAVFVVGPGTISNFTFNFVADFSANSFVNGVKVVSQCPSNFGFAINTTSSQWALVKDVVQAPVSSFGLVLFGPNNVVALCNISDTISVDTNNNVVVGNIASNNAGGIFVTGSNNQIYANTTNNNSTGDGIDVIGGALGNILSENSAFGNLPYDMEDDNANCGTNIWVGNKFSVANQTCIR